MQVALPWLSRRLAQSCRYQILRASCCPPKAQLTETARWFTYSRTNSQESDPTTPENTFSLRRQQALLRGGFQEYPRSYREEHSGVQKLSIRKFKLAYEQISDPEELKDAKDHYICGRVTSIRKAGSKLLFLQLADGSENEGRVGLQIYISLSALSDANEIIGEDGVKQFGKLVALGDTIAVIGKPYRTDAGQFSLSARATPALLAPCLHMNVTDFGPNSDYANNRYVRMRTNTSDIDVLRARSDTVHSMHDFFRKLKYTNVQTPILAASAGGAVARPFLTTATEFPRRKLSLRVAPELWLKKLIVGGLNRVYEIGPAFRNEGIDKTHNPEFTTCEFYATYMGITVLKATTRDLIWRVVQDVDKVDSSFRTAIAGSGFDAPKFGQPWSSIDFLTEVNKSLGQPLPSLSEPDARTKILEIFQSKNISIPATPTLPRLLDKLCSIYVEPLCDNATWIIQPPECLSPLAKSIPHPQFPEQSVAVCAELFIHKREVVNCYEEENSPFEQRRKFVDQQRLARLPSENGKPEEQDDEAMQVDEDYIRALEWGMPPTGGWGCGIDRLLMLMLGKERIEDVLTFGNLRSVTWGAERTQQADTNSEETGKP